MISRCIPLIMRNVTDKSCRENKNTRFMFHDFFFFFRKSYRLCGKTSTAGQATDDNIIRRMRFECWVTRLQARTHSRQYLLLCHGKNGYESAPSYDYQFITYLVYGEELLAPRPTKSCRTTFYQLSTTVYSVYSWLPVTSGGHLLLRQTLVTPYRGERKPFTRLH